jgi:metal-responsive CopG/Arc/MetJ family transcriptional regulator
MASIKTAISLPKTLFDQADALAKTLKVSRSRLFVMAVEEFIRRYQNQQLLDRLNQAFREAPNAAETERLRQMRRVQRTLVEGDW